MLYFETKHPNEPDYISNERFTDFEFGLHLHPHFEIMYVSKGCLKARVGDRDFDIPAGSVCFIMSMQAHSFETPVQSECHVCVFSTSFLPDFNEKYRKKMPVNPVFDFSDGAQDLAALENPASNRYALVSVFYRVVARLVESAEFIDRNERLDTFIQKSLDFIAAEFDKEPTMGQLADSLGYDTHYCSRLFNRAFKKNFSSMVNEYRVLKARTMLSGGNITVTQAAASCGFSCIRSFNRNYLKITGTTPSSEK